MTVTATYFGPVMLADEVGLQRWQFERAAEVGLLPPRGHARGWTAEQVEQVRALVPTIIDRFGAEHPIGAGRCAERLAVRTGLSVEAADIAALAEAGDLEVAETFSKRGRVFALFCPHHVDALLVERVEEVIGARLAWMSVSVSESEAAEFLGWHRTEFTTVVKSRELRPGRFGRWARADIEALAADEELVEQVRADRLVTADQAAGILGAARRHFDIAVEAGWISARRVHDKEVGRYSSVAVPLYRTGDVEALLARPDVDWAAVRACGKGERSPLLDIVGSRKTTRAQAIRSFLRTFGAEHSVEMWGWWVPGPNRWEIDWTRAAGAPTKADVLAAIEADPVMRQYRADLTLSVAAGAAIRFARAMLEPGAAVILDTETTDMYGAICEIAVIDACTGKTLLDTLVNPGVAIEPGAAAVHGLTDADVSAAGVPDWPTVYRRLLQITRGRKVLAYNAEYDRQVIAADCLRSGIRRTRLADPQHWADVMVPRSDHARSSRWLPNGGGHRALDDVQTTRGHLLRMTAP